MHNGFIAEFPKVKREVILAVDESLYADTAGQSDTEVLFSLALTLGLEEDPPEAVSRTIGLVERVGAAPGRQVPLPGDDRDDRRHPFRAKPPVTAVPVRA
jgi:predicted glutamine amidotransferase